MKPAVRAQIKYLELLKDYGLLEQAMLGRLPDHVMKAAKTVAALATPGVKFNKEKCEIVVDGTEQSEVDREVEEFLLHYRLAVKTLPTPPRPPRQIHAGKVYDIIRGSYVGGQILIKGEDKDVYGSVWRENFGHPLCEGLLFRIERDKLPLNGRYFVGILGGQEVIVHEVELGRMVN